MISIKNMKTIKDAILLVFIILGFLSCATNTHRENYFEQKRYFDEFGGFSIIPPEKWKVSEISGYRYKVLVEQNENGFTPYIGFVISIFDEQLPLNECVNLFIDKLTNVLGKDFELLQRDSFVTLKKFEGERVIFNVTLLGQHLRQYCYFFTGNDNKVIEAVCTVAIDSGNKYDEMFDKSMKTFEWKEYTKKNNMVNKEGYFIEETGNFLIIPNGSWQVKKFSRTNYNSLIWGNNNAIIDFEISVFNGEVNEFVDLLLEGFNNKYNNRVVLIQRSSFVTLKNLKGVKITLNLEEKGEQFRLILFCFPGKDNKILSATCAAYEGVGNFYNVIFDKTMASFEWVE